MPLHFTVGQLAKLCHVSKQTLIYYDREDVFKPEYVDAQNGYRYYTANQLELLDSILILKEIGLSLAEIKQFMAGRSEENALAMLRRQHAHLENKLAQLTLVANRLSHKIETLEQFDTHTTAITWHRQDTPEMLAVQPVPPPGGLLEVDLAVKALFRQAQKQAYAHFYQIGTMIRAEDLQQKNYLKASYTFLPIEQQPGDASAFCKPAGLYVCGYHKGTYESIGTTYCRLLAALQKEHCKPTGYSYEYCILDSLTSKASTEYVTEIQIEAIPL